MAEENAFNNMLQIIVFIFELQKNFHAIFLSNFSNTFPFYLFSAHFFMFLGDMQSVNRNNLCENMWHVP